MQTVQEDGFKTPDKITSPFLGLSPSILTRGITPEYTTFNYDSQHPKSSKRQKKCKNNEEGRKKWEEFKRKCPNMNRKSIISSK